MTVQPIGVSGANKDLWDKFQSLLNPTLGESAVSEDRKWDDLIDKGHLSIHDLLDIADTDDDKDVLLIDYRLPAIFRENHITLFHNLVNIDPSFVKSGYSLNDLHTHTMVLNSNIERNMMRQLKIWKLVVVFDQQSTKGKVASQLSMFLDILKNNDIKPLLLDGGFNEWEMFMDGKISRSSVVEPAVISAAANVAANTTTKVISTSTPITRSKRMIINSGSLGSAVSAMHIQCGLYNLGNTCYMNSALQCLVHIQVFTNYIIKGEFKVQSGLKLTNEYRNLLKSMISNSKKGIPTNPKLFKKLLGTLNDQFKGFDQQDSSEFLHFILDSIHEELNIASGLPTLPPLTENEEMEREKMPLKLSASLAWDTFIKRNNSMVIDTFCGQYSSKLQCWKCHFTSTTFIPFTMLSLPIPKMESGVVVDTYDCLDSFTKPEKLIGDNSWKCPRCGEQKASLKKLSITRLPKVLIIHLERFKYSSLGGGKFEKDNRIVQIDDSLEMAGYLSSGETEGLLQKYKLNSFVSHYGTLTSGHYKAASSDIVFDDERISRSGAGLLRNGAFVVFYERVA